MSSATGFLPAFMMFMSVGMRGSLISLTTVATAGSAASRVSIVLAHAALGAQDRAGDRERARVADLGQAEQLGDPEGTWPE